MSYTFDELANWWQANVNTGPIEAQGTLVRTQESGVTGFMPFVVQDLTGPAFTSLKAQGLEQFSDRMVTLVMKGQKSFSYTYEQNFDARNITTDDGFVAVDLATLNIRTLGGTRAEVIVTFEKWGAIPPFEIDLSPGMKVYSGVGQGVGDNNTRAIYLLSIQAVGPVVIN